MSDDQLEPPSGDPKPSPERVGDALRTAVERTLASSAGSASETGQRARELLDEVVRRGELAREEIGRRGEAAREGVTRRRDAARDDVLRRGEEVSRRLSEAIAELRRDDLGPLGERVAAIEARLAELEGQLRGEPHESGPSGGKPKSRVEGENPPGKADSGA